MISPMRNPFSRENRDARRLVAQIENVLDREQFPEAETVKEMLSRYGRETPDSRGRGGPALRSAIKHARDENRWTDAVPVFLDEAARQPDHETPYVWLVSFLDREERARSAIEIARSAAKHCKTKHSLLMRAAEVALFSGNTREAIHLFSQSIATAGRPPRYDEPGLQRPFLFMAVFFDLFGDAAGAGWVDEIDLETEFEADYVDRIRRAAQDITDEERALIRAELPEISKALKERLLSAE